jgi:diguanylate cyclase (GGDEF)-like protein
MLHVDVLTAYLICGVSALAGAAMLRLARPDEARLRSALGWYAAALVTFGLGLVPAGLGPVVGQPAFQLRMTFGTLCGILLLAHGLGLMQGRDPSAGVLAALVVGLALGLLLAQAAGAMVLGRVYAATLALCTAWAAWQGRGFVASPRNATERVFGLVLLLVVSSSWLRLACTIAYDGPPRIDLLYLPEAVLPALAATYGVLPIVFSTLLLGLFNSLLQQRLHRRASTDELTGVLTRRALRETAPALVAAELGRGGAVAVLILDIDHFKAVNDRAGHACGDEALRLAAATLQAQLRSDAPLARYGGEEFVAIVPVDGLPAARAVAERLRLAVEQARWRAIPGLETGLTISIGVAMAGPGEPLDAALARADDALYRAKRDGRNQVQVSLQAA